MDKIRERLQRLGNRAVSRINHTYVYESRRREGCERRVEEQLDIAQKNGINVLLCDVGCYRMRFADDLSDTMDYGNLGCWIKGAHERGMIVLACFNYAIKEFSYGPKEGTTGTYDDYIRAEMCRHADIVVNRGVEYNGELYCADGLQMDVEPFRERVQGPTMVLLRALREVIGEDAIFSMATPAQNGVWSDGYAADVIRMMDMLCPMVYDTCGPAENGGVEQGVSQTVEQYKEIVRRTCDWYTRLISAYNPDCVLSITAPCYDDRSMPSEVGYPDAKSGIFFYHLNREAGSDRPMEKMSVCLTAVCEAMDAGAHVDGCGIFFWPSFLGIDRRYQPEVHPLYDPQEDRAAWENIWLTYGK